MKPRLVPVDVERTRRNALALAAVTIAFGLAVHWHGGALAPAARDVLGDVLWAVMVTFLFAAIAPRSGLASRAALALALCFAVEFSQRWHSPILDAIRRMTAGELTLGTGFDPRDLAAYTAGVLTAAVLERTLIQGRR